MVRLRLRLEQPQHCQTRAGCDVTGFFAEIENEGLKILKINGWFKGISYSQMGVSKNKGTPKWMVKVMENPIKMDDLGIPFLETPK